MTLKTRSGLLVLIHLENFPFLFDSSSPNLRSPLMANLKVDSFALGGYCKSRSTRSWRMSREIVHSFPLAVTNFKLGGLKQQNCSISWFSEVWNSFIWLKSKCSKAVLSLEALRGNVVLASSGFRWLPTGLDSWLQCSHHCLHFYFDVFSGRVSHFPWPLLPRIQVIALRAHLDNTGCAHLEGLHWITFAKTHFK